MQRPRRVLLVTHIMRLGGVETFMLRLARYLKSRGMDVTIMTTSEPGEWYHRITESGYTARSLSKPRWGSSLLQSWRVGRAMARGRYDVIFLNHAKFAQRAIGFVPDEVPVIPILHNDVEQVYRLGLLHPTAWNVAVADGQKVFDTAVDRQTDRPILHIPYGVEIPEPAVMALRAAWSQPLQLLYLGRFEQASKGIFLLPEIMEQCVARGLDVQLNIAGMGSDEAELRRLCETSTCRDRINFLGTVPHHEVYGVMQRHHVQLLPSFHEGLPIVLLETQACGCAVVASRLPGITDQAVEDGITGTLVEPGDTGGFAEAIAVLANDQERWTAMSGAAHARAARLFSVEAMGQAYVNLIEETLAGKYPLPAPRHTIRRQALLQKKF